MTPQEISEQLMLSVSDYDLLNYESPIDLIQKEMEMQVEDYIMKAVMKCGVNVNKEELLKALKYDRNQYNKGYKAGCAKCRQEIIDLIRENTLYIPTELVNKLITIGIS